MIIFLYGADTPRLRAHAAKIQERFQSERDPSGMNVVVVDAATEEVPAIKEQLLAMPFLAQKRMVVLQNLFEADDEVLTWFESRYDDFATCEDGVFVLMTNEDAVKKSAFFKKLSAEKFAVAFPIPEGAKLGGWIGKQVTQMGGSIDQRAAAYLMAAIPQDTAALSLRLHQLVAYAGDAMITEEMARAFVGAKGEDVMFALMDAVTKRDRATALRLLEAQREYGSDEQQLFGMLVRQYRILADLISYREANPRSSEKEMAEALGLHPFVVKKTLPMLRSYTVGDVARAVEQLLRIDQNVKRGAADFRELLVSFVCEAS